MTGKPKSLGDASSTEYAMQRQSVPLPSSRALIVKAFETILAQGLVQRVVVEIGKPIEVMKLVPKTEMLPDIPEEVESDDLLGAVHRAEIEEFSPTLPESPLHYTMSAFNKFADRGMKPKAFLVADRARFLGWLGCPSRPDIFGLPVHVHDDIPDDVVVFAASRAGEENEVAFSLRMEMPLPKKGES